MSGSGFQQKGRKKYESSRTLAQIWTGRAILAGIIAVVGLILYQFGFTVYLLFAKPDQDGPLIWASKEGIGFSAKGGAPSGVFKLPSMTGEKVSNPRYAIVGGYLVFYSPDSHSLCVTNGTDNPRWIPLEAAMGDCRVRDIRPDGDVAVTLVGYPTASPADSLPAAVAVARHVIGSNDVVLVDGDAIRDKAKTVERKGTVFSGVSGAPVEVTSWDYDPKGDHFAAGDGKTVTSVAAGVKKEFGLGVLYHLRGVQTRDSEVWLTAVKPFKAGYLLLTYGADGTFKKVKVKNKSEMRPPYLTATPEVVELLTKVSGGVSE